MIATPIGAVCALVFVTISTIQAVPAADSDDAVIRRQAADFARAFAAGAAKSEQWDLVRLNKPASNYHAISTYSA